MSGETDIVAQAMKKFIAAGFKDEQPIRKRWFYDAFKLEEPKPTMTVAQANPLELAFLTLFGQFRTRLLEDYSLLLKSDHGSGCYSIVPAKNQVEHAQKQFDGKIGKVFKVARNSMAFIRYEELSPGERAAANNALAAVASMQSHLNAERAAARRRNMRE